MSIPFPNRNAFRHWPKWLEAALWLVLLIQLARFAWMLFAPASIGGAPHVVVFPEQIPLLDGYDPFLSTTAQSATSGLDGWQLFGLRRGNDGEGTAILARDKQPQAAYRTGDEIAPGLVLSAVSAEYIEFGDGQRLGLVGAASSSVPAAARAMPTRPADAASFDPARLLEAGLQARTEDGRITGYTLLPRGNSELLLRAAGLQPGDVLLSVNGQFLSPSVIAALANELKPDVRAVVTFERDGQTRTLNLGSGTP